MLVQREAKKQRSAQDNSQGADGGDVAAAHQGNPRRHDRDNQHPRPKLKERPGGGKGQPDDTQDHHRRSDKQENGVEQEGFAVLFLSLYGREWFGCGKPQTA